MPDHIDTQRAVMALERFLRIDPNEPRDDHYMSMEEASRLRSRRSQPSPDLSKWTVLGTIVYDHPKQEVRYEKDIPLEEQ